MKRLGPDVWDDENEEPIRKIGDQTLIEDEKLNELQRMVDEGNARFKDDGSRYTLPDAETMGILNRLTKVNPEPEVKNVETIKKIAQQNRSVLRQKVADKFVNSIKQGMDDVDGNAAEDGYTPSKTYGSPETAQSTISTDGFSDKTNNALRNSFLGLGAAGAAVGLGKAYGFPNYLGSAADRISDKGTIQLPMRRNATDFQYLNSKAQPIVESPYYKQGLPPVIEDNPTNVFNSKSMGVNDNIDFWNNKTDDVVGHSPIDTSNLKERVNAAMSNNRFKQSFDEAKNYRNYVKTLAGNTEGNPTVDMFYQGSPLSQTEVAGDVLGKLKPKPLRYSSYEAPNYGGTFDNVKPVGEIDESYYKNFIDPNLKDATDFNYLNPKAQPIVESTLYKQGLPPVIRENIGGAINEQDLMNRMIGDTYVKAKSPEVYRARDAYNEANKVKPKNIQPLIKEKNAIDYRLNQINRNQLEPTHPQFKIGNMNDMVVPREQIEADAWLKSLLSMDAKESKIATDNANIAQRLNVGAKKMDDFVPYPIRQTSSNINPIEEIIAENQLKGLENGLVRRPMRSTVTRRMTKSLPEVSNIFEKGASKLGGKAALGALASAALFSNPSMAAQEALSSDDAGSPYEVEALQLAKVTGLSYDEALRAIEQEREMKSSDLENQIKREYLKSLVGSKFKGLEQY